jgi:hypothetical protein
MPLIDKTYFVGELNIPGTGNAAISERLDLFISKYEKDFLKKVLGTALYNTYTTGIAVTPTPNQIWIDLRDGKDYQVGDVTYSWFGFANATTKQSPIANYVYYWWMRSDTSAKPDDAEQQAAYYERRNGSMARAWNEMSRWVLGENRYGYLYSSGLLGFLRTNSSVYGDWKDFTGYNIYREFAPINLMNL